MYVDHRGPELAEESLQNHEYRLNTFVEFCEENEIENLNELTGRDCHRYRTWRSRPNTNHKRSTGPNPAGRRLVSNERHPAGGVRESPSPDGVRRIGRERP